MKIILILCSAVGCHRVNSFNDGVKEFFSGASKENIKKKAVDTKRLVPSF